MDLDALIIQPLPDLPNFIGRESIDHEFLAAGILKSISYFKKIRPIFAHGPGAGGWEAFKWKNITPKNLNFDLEGFRDIESKDF